MRLCVWPPQERSCWGVSNPRLLRSCPARAKTYISPRWQINHWPEGERRACCTPVLTSGRPLMGNLRSGKRRSAVIAFCNHVFSSSPLSKRSLPLSRTHSTPAFSALSDLSQQPVAPAPRAVDRSKLSLSICDVEKAAMSLASIVLGSVTAITGNSGRRKTRL